jgi:hypothetical protein
MATNVSRTRRRQSKGSHKKNRATKRSRRQRGGIFGLGGKQNITDSIYNLKLDGVIQNLATLCGSDCNNLIQHINILKLDKTSSFFKERTEAPINIQRLNDLYSYLFNLNPDVIQRLFTAITDPNKRLHAYRGGDTLPYEYILTQNDNVQVCVEHEITSREGYIERKRLIIFDIIMILYFKQGIDLTDYLLKKETWINGCLGYLLKKRVKYWHDYWINNYEKQANPPTIRAEDLYYNRTDLQQTTVTSPFKTNPTYIFTKLIKRDAPVYSRVTLPVDRTPQSKNFRYTTFKTL